MKLTVIDVMQKLGAAFGASFSPYVPELCPYLLKVVQTDKSVERRLTCKVKCFFFVILTENKKNFTF